MVSDDEEDPISAFFRGAIKFKRKAIVEPNFTTKSAKIENEPKKWKRDIIEEPSTSASAVNQLLTIFLNSPTERLEQQCTLGIEREIDEEKPQLWPRELQIFSRYVFNLPKQNLPIAQKHDEILETIKRNKIVIIKADTGSGKSSQVPQYILDDAFRHTTHCNIIVTQPRRISAKLLGERVALERRCEVGSLVGYQIGLDKNMDHNDTRILYCTVGVFLQKLISQKSVRNWTHVIIDEIHERDIEMDQVLLILRRIMIAQNPNVKLILMSATLNCEKIAKYFEIVHPVPILKLAVPKPFQVKVQYLDDLTHLGADERHIDMESPGISREMYEIGAKLVELLIAKGVGTFLVFLPGINEIESVARELALKTPSSKDFKIIKLHSSIPTAKFPELHDHTQRKKIILATNIAESSVTIRDIEFVIDFCLTKYVEAERDSNLTQLKVAWASKINLIQRAGRTGRTNVGQVVRMIFEKHYRQLEEEPKAEMQRLPLENVILKAKQLDMGKPCDILAISLDPPTRSAIVDAILSLKANFALTRYMDREFNFLDGKLTFVGRVMGKLPIDIRLSLLIVLGNVFSVYKEAVIIAAGMSVKSIFQLTPYHTRMGAYETKLRYDSSSDCIALLDVYEKYSTWKTQQKKAVPFGVENDWCNRHLADMKNLREMEKLIKDIHIRLQEFDMDKNSHQYASRNEKLMVIKMCIAGAFYPNVYTYGGSVPQRDEFKTMNDKNLCSTIYFKSFQQTGHGHLYEDQFRKILLDNEVIDGKMEASISFDGNSSRVFIDFNNARGDAKTKMPGDVKPEVYKAVKLRQMSRRGDLFIKVMNQRTQEEYEDEYQSMAEKILKFKDHFNIYPNNQSKQSDASEYLCGTVTNIVSPGKFYFQPKKGKQLLEKLMGSINDNLCAVSSLIHEIVGCNNIMVKHEDTFNRGHILKFPKPDDHQQFYKVRLIDFGTIITCTEADFYTAIAEDTIKRKGLLAKFFELPPLCYECKLMKVQPTVVQQYGWSKEAKDYFTLFTKDDATVQIDLYAFNYSDKLASVDVIFRDPCGKQKRMTDTLIGLNVAVLSNESYVTSLRKFNRNILTSSRYEMLREPREIQIPERFLEQRVNLDGPYSPLETSPFPIYRNRENGHTIDSSSVCSVLFDQYAYDGVQKALIATAKSKNEKGNVLLRQLTLMPHAVGITSLIALIFSPYAEVRFDKNNTRCTSILTGLGCDFSGMPYFGEYDSLIRTDVELDDQDFQMINTLRRDISTLVENPACSTAVQRNNIPKLLKKIITRSRNQLGIVFNDNIDGFDWDSSKDEGYPEREQMLSNHQVPRLGAIPQKTVTAMYHHIQDLDRKAMGNTSRDQEVECKLCAETLSLLDLPIHLNTSMHVNLRSKYLTMYNNR